MKISIKLILLISIISVFSCTKIIDVDIENNDAKYLIEAHLFNEDGNNLVYVRKTQNVFDDVIEPVLQNATVTITDEEGNVFDLPYNQNGYYTNATLTGEPEKTYNLKVEIDGNTFTSESTMPKENLYFQLNQDIPFRSFPIFPSVLTDFMDSIIVNFGVTEFNFDDFLVDPSIVPQSVLELLEIESTDELISIIKSDTIESIRVCSPDSVTGFTNEQIENMTLTEKNNLFSFYFIFSWFYNDPNVNNFYWFDYDRKGNDDEQIYIGDDLALGSVTRVPFFNNCFFAGEEVNALMYEITEPVYNYLTVIVNVQNNGSPFGDVTPQNPEGNIEGENVIGFFNVASIKRSSIIIGE